ncbi:hypothetical protein TruAng_000851 [Truncatella angustata]|nr:hypothetical protein TruAng_000851 [Truncatella angustata]
MGWLRKCLDFVLQITQLASFTDFPTRDDIQRPLFLPSELLPETVEGSCPSAQCVSPQPFKCSYPKLEKKGWEFCNTGTSRDCWIRDPNAVNPVFSQYDILTDYENLDQVPPGILREVKPDGIQKILGTYFNGSYPGPTIEACWGDQLVIHVTNKVADNGTTVHWHGIRQLNSNEMDGVNGITQCPISYEDHFTYNFTATQYGHTLYENEMRGVPPATDSIVVNGKGHFQNATDGSYYQACFTPGKKHLLKLINGAASTSFKFSIDDHTMTVVANDLVAVEPFEVDSLFIGIGQRYTVIIEAKAEANTDYWIRTVPNFVDGGTDNATAIARYNSASTTCPTSIMDPRQNASCEDVHTDLLNPKLEWRIDRHPQNNVTKDTFFAQVENTPNTLLGPPGFPYVHWTLAEHPLWIDFSKPTILDVQGALDDPNYIVVEEEYDHGFVYLVLDSSRLAVAHPIHLHGSDFVILAQSNQTWNETTSPKQFRYDNPPRRDVAMLPGGGFLAIAFKPDNPGAWLLHCHIAWHASSGLALQVLIRPKDMPHYLGDLKETHRVCEEWRSYNLSRKIMAEQEDSGI